MPRDMPDIPGFGLAGDWRPAREVAGDFYDIFPLDEDRWGLVIGDVAGKGTAAALYMAMVHSLILSGALRQRSLATVLREVNQTIHRQFSARTFVSVFLAVVDPQKQTLRYANAGHNPPLVRRASGTIELLTRTGTVLGLFEDLHMSETTITLGAGDAVVMYTDGVTEAMDAGYRQFGIARLREVMEACAGASAREAVDSIVDGLKAFAGDVQQSDDITILIARRCP